MSAPTDHYPPGELPDSATLARVLEEVTATLRRSGIDFLLMGGVGNATLARPRVTNDIDVFVRPDEAERVLETLDAAGFTTEKRDPRWLYKAWKDGVLVDVIFRSIGDVYLDDEMMRRRRTGVFQGIEAPVLAPEDLLVIKAVATMEDTPHHWYDALGIIARCDLDWDYVLRRARAAGPRRVLSLLIFAESNDLAVPADAIETLYDSLHPRLAPKTHGTAA